MLSRARAGIIISDISRMEEDIKYYDLGNFVSGPDITETRQIQDRENLGPIMRGQKIPKDAVKMWEEEIVTYSKANMNKVWAEDADTVPKNLASEGRFYVGELIKPITFTIFEPGRYDLYSVTFEPPHNVFRVGNTINIPLYDYHPPVYVEDADGRITTLYNSRRILKLNKTKLRGGKRISRKRTYRRKTRKVKSRRRA